MATHNIFKDKINDLAGTKQLGKDESALIRMKKVFENADARSQARGPISLRDIGIGGVGGTIAGLPGVAVGAIASQVWQSPKVTKLVSESSVKASEMVRGASKLPRSVQTIGKGGYDASRLSSRVASPPTTLIPQQRLNTQQMPSANQTYPPIIPSPTSTQNELAKQYNIWSQSLKPKPLTEQEKQMRKRLGM